MIWFGILGGVDDWLKLTSQIKHRSRNGLRPWEKLLFHPGNGQIVEGLFSRDAGIALASPGRYLCSDSIDELQLDRGPDIPAGISPGRYTRDVLGIR